MDGFDERSAQDLLGPLMKLKGNKEVFGLCADLLNVLVAEALQRARIEAQREDVSVITVEHFKRVLPQLLLDFC